MLKRELRSGLLLAMVVVATNATGSSNASAKESPAGSTICSPACQPGATCIGGTCMIPAEAPPPPPAFPPPGAPPPGGPPPAYPQQPPPAPMYAPYPGYRPVPQPMAAYAEPVKPTKMRRFLALPYIGTHSYQGGANAAYFPGFRIGTLIGGRITEQFSLNWELTFDVSNIDEPTPPPPLVSSSSSEFAFDFAFSPMLHFPAGPADFVLGPKLGVFWVHTDVRTDGSYSSTSHQGTGILGGLTVGTFMAVSPNTSLGVLVSGELRAVEHACDVNAGEVALCDLARDSAAKILGLTAAAMFR
jgi:hypothetical protein